jgi:hypothetical protein
LEFSVQSNGVNTPYFLWIELFFFHSKSEVAMLIPEAGNDNIDFSMRIKATGWTITNGWMPSNLVVKHFNIFKYTAFSLFSGLVGCACSDNPSTLKKDYWYEKIVGKIGI